MHDFIPVRESLLLQIIDTPEFQRLRRLRQLGSAAGTYHGAEHSRFGHSLGAMHVMGKVLAHLRRAAGAEVDEEVELVARAAALVHDVGHGPLSHGLERVLTPGAGHEEWTERLILEPTHLHAVLEGFHPGLAARIVDLLRGTLPASLYWLHTLVASQLDVDRMDYLLRDALYTGAFYGRFDLERLVHTLTLVDGRIAFSYKGIPTAEEYVLARHYMYWQVYFHKTTRAQDLVLRAAWRRARELAAEGVLRPDGPWVPPSLVPFLWDTGLSLEQYVAVDDHDVLYAVKLWQGHPDPILADMAARFLHRRLLKPFWRVPPAEIDPEWLDRARRAVARRGLDPSYYCQVDRTSDVAYDVYTGSGPGGGSEPILAVDEAGRLQEISRASELIRAVAARHRTAVNLFLPAEVRAEVAAAVGG